LDEMVISCCDLNISYRKSNWNSDWNASVRSFMLESWMGISFLRLW